MKLHAPLSAFSLLEVMLALTIMGMIFTAATVSLRGRWRTEQARRAAGRVALACAEARSHAWREGREWLVLWNARESSLLSCPASDTSPASARITALDRSLRLDAPDLHFLPNGRAEPMSWIVQGPHGDAWRIRIQWDGSPVLEAVTAN